jgi:hypothetical protein
VSVSVSGRVVTTDPTQTNPDRAVESGLVASGTAADARIAQAQTVLGESIINDDVEVVAAVLADTAADRAVGVVSDDRRMRTTVRRLSAQVTGTVGVVIRGVKGRVPADEAGVLVVRPDANGLHMTGALRTRAAVSGSQNGARRGSTVRCRPRRPSSAPSRIAVGLSHGSLARETHSRQGCVSKSDQPFTVQNGDSGSVGHRRRCRS